LAPAQMAVNLGAGALSGVVSTLCIYPLDVIRRRMQLQVQTRPRGKAAHARVGGCFLFAAAAAIFEMSTLLPSVKRSSVCPLSFHLFETVWCFGLSLSLSL
jgi:hypothetical protein